VNDPLAAESHQVLGRDVEVAAIDEWLAVVATNDGASALVLVGEPGIGKTALWREGVRRARQRGRAVLSATPARADGELAYAGLSDLLADVPPDVIASLPAAQGLALRVAMLDEPPTGPPIDRRTVAAGFLSVLRRLTDEGPLVLAIDDLQWLDAPSRGAVEFAVRRMERLPVGLFLGLRGDEAELTPLGLGHAILGERLRRLAIGPLTVAAIYQLLRIRLGHAFARPTLLRIAEWAGGNPLFALEIGRVLIASAQPLEPGAPPPVSHDLAEALGDRVRSLPIAVRRTLLVAAASPHPTTELVTAACLRLGWDMRLPDDPTIIDASGPVLRFAHPLLAAQALAAGSTNDRRAANGALSELVVDSEERVRHLALAATGPDEHVAAALEAAGLTAAARGAPEVAAELVDLACRLSPSSRAPGLLRRRRELGELLLRIGEGGRARSVLRTAALDGRPGPERALAKAVFAELVLADEGLAAAADLCQSARSDAGADRLVAARVELAWSAAAHDAHDQLAHAQAALHLVGNRRAGLRARALGRVAVLVSSLGQRVPPELLEEAVALEAVEPPARLAESAVSTRAWLHHMDDELELAHREYEELCARAEQLGDESSLAWMLVELAQIDLRAGRWDEVPVHAAAALRVAEQADQPRDRMFALIQLGAVAAARGDRAAAEPYFDEVGAYAAQTGDPLVRAIVAGNLGALAMAEGDAGAAERLFDEAARHLGGSSLTDTALGRFQADRLEALAAVGEV
jgi:tetratricopeptide (TPR) repeat protein